MKNKKILLFNDTDGDYHFGCSATSQALKYCLGITDNEYTHKVTDWNRTPFPYYEKDFDDDDFFAQWSENNNDIIKQILVSDICVFTCEGTLHGYDERPGTRNLLYMIYICKMRYNKKTFVINCSCYPVYNLQDVSKENLACIIYKKVLEKIDKCIVRERASLAILNKLGVNAKIAFDCLPLYVKLFYQEAMLSEKLNKNYTLISGGSTLHKSFYKFIKNLWKNYKINGDVYFLASCMPEINADDKHCIEEIQKFNKKFKTKLLRRKIKILYTKSTNEWLSVIKRGKLFVSGRFHHSIAAAIFQTPYVCLDANTPKTDALKMITKPDELWKLSLENFEEILGKDKFEALKNKIEEHYND